MRIGIIPSLDPHSGGIHQYSLTLLEIIARQIKQDAKIDYALLANPNDIALLGGLKGARFDVVPLEMPRATGERIVNAMKIIHGEGFLAQSLKRIRKLMPSDSARATLDFVRRRKYAKLATWLRNISIDWLFFTAPNHMSFNLGLPYVMPVHDLQHRLHPEFPEVSADGQWEAREHLYRNGISCATLILADSEVGKDDILEFYKNYGATPDKVKVLPFLPYNFPKTNFADDVITRFKKKFKIPERYLFYPAQFWPHKNHARIIRALAILNEKSKDKIHLVFCGSNKNTIRMQTFQDTMKLANSLGVENEVHYLGYVTDYEISILYSEALALIMPTFFGPTNIPVLEAWSFNCPVITSDVRGIREQVGDAGFLVDPTSVDSISEAIFRVWTDPQFCRELIDRGTRRLAVYSKEDFCKRLSDIIQEACSRIVNK
jgi:glycosyltransferase involved in cell wall biosynthesis